MKATGDWFSSATVGPTDPYQRVGRPYAPRWAYAECRRGLAVVPAAARLRRALATLADLELDARGGPALAAAREGSGALDEDTLALRAIERICLRP